MTPAVSETVSEIEVFRQQARMTHAVVRKNVEGVTQEESLIQPQPGGNCLNWVVGHLVCIYNKALPRLGQQPVAEAGDLKRYDRGAPPLENPDDAVDIGKLMTAWDEVTRRIDAGLASLTAEVLDQPVPQTQSPGNNPNETVRTFLATIFFHQAYHAGQTGTLRRITGKEGAIR